MSAFPQAQRMRSKVSEILEGETLLGLAAATLDLHPECLGNDVSILISATRQIHDNE